MAPTIHFVRHAQGFHNLSYANQAIHDPLLTPFGEQQCKLLYSTFPYTAEVDGIVASPLRRTVYTALLSFPEHKSQIITLPELQETSDQPCDTGSSKEDLEKEFTGKHVDFSHVIEGWNNKKAGSKWSPERSMVEERARVARRWLMARPEKHLVVVTHGGLLHHLTEDWIGSDHIAGTMQRVPKSLLNRAEHYYQKSGTGWANTEYRSYNFDPSKTATASLIETEESRTRRRGVEKPLSDAEQRNLKATAEKEWEKQGYVKADSERQQQPIKVSAKV